MFFNLVWIPFSNIEYFNVYYLLDTNLNNFVLLMNSSCDLDVSETKNKNLLLYLIPLQAILKK